ncbi:MAG: hypothetical protein QGH45_10660 [Myxococcota bacterium]|nr:hypothetical protein [Myxococcota bacterium]
MELVAALPHTPASAPLFRPGWNPGGCNARRRAILQRRSVAEGLLQRYETASQCLRRASAFSDELRLCALELQQQVDELHAELAKSEDNRLRAAEAVVSLDDAIAALEEAPPPSTTAPATASWTSTSSASAPRPWPWSCSRRPGS